MIRKHMPTEATNDIIEKCILAISRPFDQGTVEPVCYADPIFLPLEEKGSRSTWHTEVASKQDTTFSEPLIRYSEHAAIMAGRDEEIAKKDLELSILRATMDRIANSNHVNGPTVRSWARNARKPM